MLRWGRSTSAPQRAGCPQALWPGWQKHTLNKPRVGGLTWQPVGCPSEPQPPPAQVVSSAPLSLAHPTSLIGEHQAPRALGLLPGPKVSSSLDGLLPSPSAQGLWEPPSCPKGRKALLWPQGLCPQPLQGRCACHRAVVAILSQQSQDMRDSRGSGQWRGVGGLPSHGASSCRCILGRVEDKTGCGRPALNQGGQGSLGARPSLRRKLPAQARLETQEEVALQGGHPRSKVGAQGWATPPSLRSLGFLFLRKVEISFLDSPVRPTFPLGQAPPLQVPAENHDGRHPTTRVRLLCVRQRGWGEETVSG